MMVPFWNHLSGMLGSSMYDNTDAARVERTLLKKVDFRVMLSEESLKYFKWWRLNTLHIFRSSNCEQKVTRSFIAVIGNAISLLIWYR